MNCFAELLDRLAHEPGRNNKLRLITAYFRTVEDPDRGYALAALTGALSFKHAKPGLIRNLIADRTDPVLFALSYDYVGDLSETVALMWPTAVTPTTPSAPSPACVGGLGWGQSRPLAQKEPPPGSPSSASALPGDPTSPASGRGEELPHPPHTHNNPRRRRRSPRSSPRFVRWARPSCRNNWRAGSTSWTRTGVGRC